MAIIRAKSVQKHSAAFSVMVYVLADDNRKGEASLTVAIYLPMYVL